MHVKKFLLLSACMSFGSSHAMWRAGALRGVAGMATARTLCHVAVGQKSCAMPKASEFFREPSDAHADRRSVVGACKLIAKACYAQKEMEEAFGMLQQAVQSGKNVDEKDEKGCSGLYYLERFAALWREKKCDACEKAVLLLLDNGADAKEVRFDDQETLLHIAVRENQVALVEPLMRAGLDMHALWKDRTPLHIAVEWNYVEMAETLLGLGADVQGAIAGSVTPLHFARSAEMVSLLVSHGAHKEARTRDGFTPLIMAAYCTHPEVVERLIVEGAKLDAVDNRGVAALRHARWREDGFGWEGSPHSKVTKLLQQAEHDRAD